jgi:hypothetical protein
MCAEAPAWRRIDIGESFCDRYELDATNYSRDGVMTPAALQCRVVTWGPLLAIAPAPKKF